MDYLGKVTIENQKFSKTLNALTNESKPTGFTI